MSFFKTVVLLTLLAAVAPQRAHAQVMVDFAHDDAFMTVAFDMYGNAQTQDTRTGAFFTYHRSGVVYAGLPDIAGYVRIAPLTDARVPEVRVERVGDGPTIQGFKTVNWRVLVNRQPCGQVFTSEQLAKVINANFTDISRLNVAMGLTREADLSPRPCTYYEVPRALGNMMGFPLAFEGVDGSTRVTDIRHGAKVMYDMPPDTITLPLTDKARAAFLRGTLTEPSQRALDAQKPKGLNDRAKLRTLEHMRRLEEEQRR